MPRVPVRVQMGNFGSQNNFGLNRKVPVPVILQRGPSQALEQFNLPSVDPTTARALNQLQKNIQAATSVAKADPRGDGSLFENVTLVLPNGNPGTSFTIINHGLGGPARGFTLHAMRGGYSQAPFVMVPPTQPTLKLTTIQLWTPFVAFGTDPVVADIWVYK